MGVAIFYSQIICAITVLILASLILIVPAVILSRKKRKKARNVVCGVMGTMVLGAGILIAWLVTHSSYPQINNLKFLGKNSGLFRWEKLKQAIISSIEKRMSLT